MADSPEDSSSSPTVILLLKELREFKEWYMLGYFLKLPTEDLKEIERQFSDHGHMRCKTELFELWLRHNPSASWENIAVALEEIGENKLAKAIRTNHLNQLPVNVGHIENSTELPNHLDQSLVRVEKAREDNSTELPDHLDQSPVRVEKAREENFTEVPNHLNQLPVKVEKALMENFTELEREFATLVTDLMSSLEKEQIPLRQLRRFVTVRLELEWDYIQATSIDEFFERIKPYYCFLNTTLLQDLIEKFIGEPLIQQLKTYKKHLDEFTSSNDIALLKEVLSHRTTNAEGMSPVVLKLTGRWLKVTIKHFQEFVNHIFGAGASALTRIRVEDGCVCISWFTHKSAVLSLVASARQNAKFLRLSGVLKLTVGDITILDKCCEAVAHEQYGLLCEVTQ